MRESLYTVEQVADYLQVHADTVRRWLRAGELQGVALGGRAGWRITASELERFVAVRTAEPKSDAA